MNSSPLTSPPVRRAALTLLVVLGCTGVLSFASPARAEPISSFENPDIDETTFSPQVEGFDRFGPSGTIDPTDVTILGSSNDGPNGGQLAGGDGRQLAILSTRPDDATPNTVRSAFLLSQRTFNVQFGQSYILDVTVADSMGTTPPPPGADPGSPVDPAIGDEPGRAQIGFLLNNAFRGADFDASNYAAEGTLRDFRFTFTPLESDSGQLRIFLGQTGSTGREVIGFDNVRLSIATAAVPEPSTYAMMFLGVGALGLMTWKRKRSANFEADFASAI